MEEIVSENKNSMTVGQATAIIVGCGVGGGVMSVPALVSKVGVPLSITILLIAFAITCFLNVMFADLAIKNGCKGQTTDILKNLVLRGKIQKPGSILLFILLSAQIVMSLGAYINGAGQIINSFFPDNAASFPYVGKFIFFFFAAALVFFSLKVLGVVEQISVILMYVALFVLIIGSCISAHNPLPINISGVKDAFSFYGIAMLSFSSFHSVPHVVHGLNGDAKKIKKSIFFGTALNFAIVLIITFFSLISCKEVTSPIIIGWSEGIGAWAKPVGGVFSLFAFLTSFWALSFALRDIIKQQFKIKNTLALILAVVPSLVIALLPADPTMFNKCISLTSALCGLIIAIFVLPGFYYQKKINNGENIAGFYGSTVMSLIVLSGYIIMAASGVVSIL